MSLSPHASCFYCWRRNMLGKCSIAELHLQLTCVSLTLGLNPFWWSSCSLRHSLLFTNNHWVADIIAVSLEAPGFVILGLSGSCNLQLLGLGPWLIVKTAVKKLKRGSWVSFARMWTKLCRSLQMAAGGSAVASYLGVMQRLLCTTQKAQGCLH